MRKNKTWEITLTDNARLVANEPIENAVVYTTDTEAYLNFRVIDSGFEFNSATIAMLNKDDGSIVERPMTKEDDTAVYEVESDIIPHFGLWQAQVLFKQGEEVFTSTPVTFVIERYMMAEQPPRLEDVVNWQRLYDNATETIQELTRINDELITTNETVQQAEAQRVLAENERSEKYGSYAQQFNDVITDLSEEKDYHSLPEISAARGGHDTLGQRLDETTAQLAQKASYDTTWNMSNMGQDVKEAMIGGSVAVVGENAVGSENIKKAAVDPTKTTFLKTGKNLFNKKTRHLDVYVSSATGVLTNNTSYDASDYIPINPNTTYTRGSTHQTAYYDADLTYLSGDSGSLTSTSPASAAFVRVTVPKSSVDTFQFEIGSTATDYEPFTYKIDDGQIDIITGKLKTRINSLDESAKAAIELTQGGRKRIAPMPKGEMSTIPADDLALWFKAESVQTVNGLVSEWRDESGFNRDVTGVEGELPKLIPNKYNGLPVVEFSALDYAKPTRLRNTNDMKIASGVKSVTLFVVAESNELIANTSRNRTPLFLSLGSSSAFIKFELHREMLISSRRLTGDELVRGNIGSQGLVRSNYKKLSLYEVDINFLEGKYELIQDGVTVGEGDLTTKGMTDADSFSRLGIGNTVSSPRTEHGFNGSIGEIIFYNDMKTGGDRKEIRNYLMKKWDIDTLDGHYTAKYSTAILNEGISKSNENLSLIGIKNGIDFNVDEPKGRFETMGYLYLDEPNQKLYYSAGRYDNPIYLCDWNRDIAGGFGCEEYNPFIAKNGDIVFTRIRSRGNPIVYKYGDYSNPVVVDFGSDSPPVAWLMDTGVDYDYENDFFIFGEYHNPTLPGEDIFVYKVTYPFENRSNWNRVLTLEMQENHIRTEGTVKHFHTVKRDIYSGMWVANTGDADYQCRNFVSIDGGETWTESGGGSQDYRIVGMIFLEDGCYWANDTQTSHALFKARRGADGYVDFAELEHLTWLSILQPSYRTCYLEEPNGILIIDRGESRTDLKLDLTFWSLDKKRLYRIDILDGLEGDTGEAFGRIGFGNQAVTAYAPKNENGVILGSTTNWKARPMSLKVLGNSIDKRLGNLKIEVLRK